MKKPWIIVLILVIAVLAVVAVSVFALLSSQKTTVAPETSKADIAPVTQTVNLSETKIVLVKNNKEVLPTDNIVAGELYEMKGKLSNLPNSNYTNTPIDYRFARVGIAYWFRDTQVGIGDAAPTIFARVKSDLTYSFKFVVAETQDIDKFIQLQAGNVYEGTGLVAYTINTSDRGYLNPTSKVVKR